MEESVCPGGSVCEKENVGVVVGSVGVVKRSLLLWSHYGIHTKLSACAVSYSLRTEYESVDSLKIGALLSHY